MRGARRPLAPRNQEKVLHETADELLAEEGQPVPAWDIVGRQIADKIDEQASDLLAEAQDEYDHFEGLRARAARQYGRLDPTVCVLAGVVVAYLILTVSGPFLLPEKVKASPGIGLTPWILALPSAALAIRWPLWLRRRRALMRSVPEAYGNWTGVLRDQVLRPFITEKRNDEERDPRLFDTTIGRNSPPRFIEASDPRRLVVTETMTRLLATARNVHSGSLGISGPRGVGKSTILQFFGTEAAAGDDRDLRLVVAAPVEYESREFIIHLFTRLCEVVLDDGSAIAAESRRRLEQLRYLRTYTTNWSASLTPRTFLTLVRSKTKQRAEQPVTLPELVDNFRRYSTQVASWRRSAHDGGRLVIGIDEVDKIRDSDRAEAFINDIKAIFDVPGTLYLVSLSEEAMAGFAGRTPSIRDSFDSAFDELVSVSPMAYRESEELLFKRVTGVPRPFTALCHVLAGGLPRDLVRAARALVDVTSASGGKSLEDTAGDLIRRELESLRQVSLRRLAETAGTGPLRAALDDPGWPGTTPRQFAGAAQRAAGAVRDADSDQARQLCQGLVVSLSFYSTALEVFEAAQDRLIACLKSQDYGIIDDLAAVRDTMRVDAEHAHQLLEQYRLRNGIGNGTGGVHAAG